MAKSKETYPIIITNQPKYNEQQDEMLADFQ